MWKGPSAKVAAHWLLYYSPAHEFAVLDLVDARAAQVDVLASFDELGMGDDGDALLWPVLT